MWLWFVANVALAREYRLDPGETSITLDGVLTVGASEIDLTATDYVLVAELYNAGEHRLDLVNLDCTRGGSLLDVSGGPGERVVLEPGERRSLQILCDHGRSASGDPSLRIQEVRLLPDEGPSAPVFKNVVWRMTETDIVSKRTGRQLATGAFDRPAPRSFKPRSLPADAPLAVPNGGFVEPPDEVRTEPAAAASRPPAPPPPAATLKPTPR